MGKSKRSSTVSSIFNIILIILFILAIIATILSSKGKLSLVKVDGVEKDTYTTIDSGVSALDYKTSIPNFIYELAENSEVSVTVTNGKFFKAMVGETVLGMTPFQVNGYNTLGLTVGRGERAKSVVKRSYNVKDNANGITYISYLYNVPNVESCTVINWSDSETNYTFVYGEKLGEEQIFELFNIDVNTLEDCTEQEKVEDELRQAELDSLDGGTKAEVEMHDDYSYVTTEDIQIYLPNFFNIDEYIGVTVGLIGEQPICAVIHCRNAKDTEDFKDENTVEKEINDNIVFRYIGINPFEQGTKEYDYYNQFITTIDDTVNSIESID